MPDQKPLVSVIIPALQEEKLISLSLVQFTPELKKKFRLEVIVSDGGSTDQTLSIARGYADIVVEAKRGERQNISIGRNSGARASHGEILMFINADTLVENLEQFLGEMIRVIQPGDAVAATCCVGVYHEEETFSDTIFHGFYNWFFQLENRLGMGMGRGECHVVKRSTFFSVNGYDESIAAGEDFELFLRLRKQGKIAFMRGLRVNESPRRYREYGYVKISFLWFLNSMFVILFHRSLHKEWKPVR